MYGTPEEVKAKLRQIGPFQKAINESDGSFEALVKVGDYTLVYYTSRENVCVKKVVGTKEVPEKVEPSYYTPEKVIPAHTEEIVEWDCGSVLAPGDGGQPEGNDNLVAPADSEDAG